MRSALNSFFMDRNYRWLTYAFSGVGSILYATLNILALHRGRTEVAVETAFLFCLFLGAGIRLYSALRTVPAPTPVSQLQPARFSGVSVLKAFAIVLGYVLTSQTNLLPKFQAIVIDVRLGLANGSITYAFAYKSPEQADKELRRKFQKVQSIADTSYRYQIPVDANSLGRAAATIGTSLRQPAISDQTKQAGLVAYAKLVKLAAEEATQANTEQAPSYVLNSPLDFSDGNFRFIGDHTPITFGDGEIYIRHSTVVFDGIDFRSQRPFKEGLFVLDSSSRVIVRDSTVENLAQTLDGILWENVQFQHSMIKLNGGPLTLVNVSFKDCDLRWLALSNVGMNLQEKISQASGKAITFAFEGNQELTPKPE